MTTFRIKRISKTFAAGASPAGPVLAKSSGFMGFGNNNNFSKAWTGQAALEGGGTAKLNAGQRAWEATKGMAKVGAGAATIGAAGALVVGNEWTKDRD